MIEFRDISLTVGKQTLLDRVSFSMAPRGITALVGRNGSGKSTLLSCIHSSTPCSGQILYQGTPLTRLSPREKAGKIALLPQDMPAPHIPVWDLVAFGRTPHLGLTGHLAPEDRAHIENALEATGTGALRHRYADSLSGGERQRVYFAMILAQNTPCIVLDEPISHLDPAYQRDFLQCLEPLKQERSILLVLHDLSLAVRYADRIAVLDRGQAVFSGTPAACLEEHILETVFGVRRYCAEDGTLFFGI